MGNLDAKHDVHRLTYGSFRETRLTLSSADSSRRPGKHVSTQPLFSWSVCQASERKTTTDVRRVSLHHLQSSRKENTSNSSLSNWASFSWESCRIMLNLSSKGVERLRFVITPQVWFVSIYLMAKPCNYNQVMQTFFPESSRCKRSGNKTEDKRRRITRLTVRI